MDTIKVGVAEDQQIYRDGLVSMLEGVDHLKVSVVAENGKDLLLKMKGQVPDVVLIDYRMDKMDGVQTTKKLLKRYPNIRVLMLSMYDENEFVIRAIENGAHGYLVKDDSPEEIVAAIESVVTTGYYLNDRTSKILITRMVKTGTIEPTFSPTKLEFSDIEMDVIKLICKEYSTNEIALKLHKSKRTIDGHRQNVMRRVGAKNATGVVMYAVKHDLIDITSDEF
ncbi:MAG: response regulator transcription factor [Crocinitomicaceae bacterium]|nr:response regulator transcription factor [Crocinitomicaceae bacterium]